MALDFTSTVDLEQVVAFRCSKCGHEVAAKVKAKGEGSAFMHLLDGTAMKTAEERARRQSLERAQDFAAMAKCPACGHVDDTAMKRVRNRSLESAVIFGLLAMVLGYSVPSLWQQFSFLPPLIGLALGWYTHNENRWLWTGADARVVFDAERRVPKHEAKAPSRTGPGDWLFPLLFLTVVALASYFFIANPYFKVENDTSVQIVQFFVASVACLTLIWGWQLARDGRTVERQLLRDRLLVAVGLASFIGYFNFGHSHFGNYVHVWDTYHYVMGSKYFPELGYDKLYDCAGVVDVESGRKDELLRRTLTDLRTNLIVKPDEIIAHPENCKNSFSPERWAAFKADINTFHSFVNEGRWKEIHQDHGYNATPVWTLAGYWLTNLGAPVSMVKLYWLNALDPLYLLLTVLIVWWAFGPRAFAIAALTLGTNFANRYYWTGGAFLRHDWVFYLVASICLMKKELPFLGGMSFAYSVLLRLFPGLVVIGPVLAAGEYLRVNKKVDPRFAKWVAGGAVATVLLVGGSFAAFGGIETWQHFAQNTVKHANTPLTNHMGLRTVLSYRPENTGQRMVDNRLIDGWRPWKDARLANWHASLPVFALLMLFAAWLIYMALRASGPDPWFGASLGIGLIVFGAELTNYYYCFLMGIAVLQVRRREVGIMLGALALMTQFINWGPVLWMSRWLDEQYVAMSLASLFAMVGIWWLFTKWGQESAMPPEPEPVVLFGGAPAVASAPSASPALKRKKR